tara:strand:+ start:389 stop:520 length:132 start_codon:yes stop_codon:yes gene_type:complete
VEDYFEPYLMAGKTNCSSFSSILESFGLAVASFDEPYSLVSVV